MSLSRKTGIFFAAFIVAIGGIVYEMIIASAASLLIGNGILHFSLAIGLFLTGMGIGSLFSNRLGDNPERNFIIVEILLGTLGGVSVIIMFLVFAYTNLFYLSFIILTIVLGALIGTEIPLMLHILKKGKNKHLLVMVSRILSIDYFGALIASLVFPLFLLPTIGILNTAFVVGVVNLLIAMLMIISFREFIDHKPKIIVMWIIGFTILIGALINRNLVQNFVDNAIFKNEVIYSKNSEYQSIVLTRFNENINLYLDGNLQFSSVDEYRYHETLIHVPFSFSRVEPEKVLILGGGDGLAAREILKYESVEKITIVDLDKSVTDLAKSHSLLKEINRNSLLNEKIEVINEDAFNYLSRTSEIYDIIVIDLPDPNNESLSKLYTKEFYELGQRHLAVEGVLITQAISPYFTNKTFWTIESTISESFENVIPINVQVPTFGNWGFVVASESDLKIQEDFEYPADNKFINNTEQVAHLEFFDNDIDKPSDDLEISTVLNSKIYITYQQEVQKIKK